MEKEIDEIDAPPIERPWIHLKTTYDVEAWINNYNHDLRRLVKSEFAGDRGCGICFILAEGGEIFMHTTSEGNILLDVTPEAGWTIPVIEAATGMGQPGTQIWQLPGYLLTQLILGISTLITSVRMIKEHNFILKKY